DASPGHSRSNTLRSGALLPLQLVAQPGFLGAKLRGELSAKVLRLEDRSNRHFDAAIEGRTLEPFHGFLKGLDLPDPVAGDQLLGLGERAVDDRALGAG